MKTLLKNGTIYDGKGNKPFIGDLLIDGDMMATVEPEIDAKVEQIIDCKGLIISPGFIDGHSHNDFHVDKENSVKYFEPFLRQGITTQVVGNCGFSVSGLDKDTPHSEAINKGLFPILKPGSYPEFLLRTKDNLYVNMAPLIGHGIVRGGISGHSKEKLTPEQLNKMCDFVDEAMLNGAFGGSFGFMYEPGMFTDREEINTFAKRVTKHDGILTFHPRALSTVSAAYSPMSRKSHQILALEEVAEIVKESGGRAVYSHLTFAGKKSWQMVDSMLEKLHELQQQSIDLNFDLYSFPYGSTSILIALSDFYMKLSKEDRQKKINSIKSKFITALTLRMLGLTFEDFVIAYIGEGFSRYEGKSVSQIAKEEGLKPSDMYLKLVGLSEGKGSLYTHKLYNDEIIMTLMKDPLSVFMTDAWIEDAGMQNGAAYQGFTNFLVLARDNGFALEDIIHKMTGKTAERFKMPGRGTLEKGNVADITVFDLSALKVVPDNPTFTSDGIKYVFVNGVRVVDDGVFIPVKAGQVLKKSHSA
jgi:N-acyl-D-aspartate/D-glutamate deacylase